jgi:hypothetical protein
MNELTCAFCKNLFLCPRMRKYCCNRCAKNAQYAGLTRKIRPTFEEGKTPEQLAAVDSYLGERARAWGVA